jgi:hypothetical protein
VIGRRKFGPEGTPNQLVNVALSEEATLAFTLLNRLQVKDLYEPWKNIPIDLVARVNQDNAQFAGLNAPDQLLVRGGRLVCLYSGGRYLRGFDLTGVSDPTPPLNTHSNLPAVWLQMVGPKVFVVRTTGLELYNLADANDHDSKQVPYENDGIPSVHMMLLGKDHAILVNEGVDRGPAGSPSVTLMAYSRANVPGKAIENGSLDFVPTVRSSAGITDWLPAEGGVYYLSKDNKLHFLRGGKQ